MDRLATLTLGDIGRGVLRYRPIVVTIVTLLALLAVLPGPRFSRAETAGATEGAVFGVGRRAATTAPAAAATSAPAVDASIAPDPAASTGPFSSGPSFSSSASTAFDDGGRASSPSSDGDSAGSAPSRGEDSAAPDAPLEGTGPSFGGGGGTSVSTVPPRLAIVASAYASATAATPLGAQLVPANTLPVAKRFGQEDKISYVRLAGQADRLELAEEPSGSRSTAGTIAIVACRVTVAGWSEGENKPFSEIPFDRNQCVTGAKDAFFGTWSFDLSAFPRRTDDKGFALVPAPGSSIDFQVAFKKS